ERWLRDLLCRLHADARQEDGVPRRAATQPRGAAGRISRSRRGPGRLRAPHGFGVHRAAALRFVLRGVPRRELRGQQRHQVVDAPYDALADRSLSRKAVPVPAIREETLVEGERLGEALRPVQDQVVVALRRPEQPFYLVGEAI